MSQVFHRAITFACILAMCVVVLGAYTRLSNAGLGCPDWPGCYGFLTVPNELHEIAIAQQEFPSSRLEPRKAWIEMIHRYFAGGLGVVVLFIFAVIVRSNQRQAPKLLAASLLVMICFQALLGMWTVTLNLQPFVVMGHLLGGFTILSLLTLIYLRTVRHTINFEGNASICLNAGLACAVVLIVQIALGGWLAANYAAPHCTGLPLCSNGELFSWSSLLKIPEPASTYEYGVLPFETRLSIHLVHRIWAVVTVLSIIALAATVHVKMRQPMIRRAANLVLVLVLAQVAIGAIIVHFDFPILLTLFHNLMAAILLLSLIRVCYFLGRAKKVML
ncbi:COX15/CtaA family protein [Pseudoalteromonas sp. SMS1]|uniref:COX15/CtaA family protein n=1 Tax=Pseudoalteromonas sp. SMS1 TaxID=2908894 RepID=UPI001F2C1E33|nr:COX15/CtaA family protein [Pseudoalteromonas sp. SMS1]MCF2859628.1 COX15/CtaA family protein [Pseudoalteromonas sp. SMS1]